MIKNQLISNRTGNNFRRQIPEEMKQNKLTMTQSLEPQNKTNKKFTSKTNLH